jgi:hypothetical protein
VSRETFTTSPPFTLNSTGIVGCRPQGRSAEARVIHGTKVIHGIHKIHRTQKIHRAHGIHGDPRSTIPLP